MSAIFCTSSVSKRSLRSFSRATGTISLSVNSRAVSRIRRCSSVSSKSINPSLLKNWRRRLAHLRHRRAVSQKSGGGILDHGGEALANAYAHGGESVTHAAPPHLPYERGEQARARAAERMAERDRAAVHDQLLVRDAELARTGQRLRRERLVQLDQPDVVDRQIGALQSLAAGRDRADAHVRGINPGGAHRHDARQRLAAPRRRALPRGGHA